jgi:hypothetical protein
MITVYRSAPHRLVGGSTAQDLAQLLETEAWRPTPIAVAEIADRRRIAVSLLVD